MNRITIKDIAKELGVSLSTVNKGLNGKPGIGEERRQSIIDTANRLGYKVNRAAKSLARNPIRIGVALPEDWPHFHEEIKNGIQYAMDRLIDYNVVSIIRYYSAVDATTEERVTKCFMDLHRNGVDAIIFCPGSYYDYYDALKMTSDLNIPVTITGFGPRDSCCLTNVEVNSAICGSIAAEFLECILPSGAKVSVILGSRDIAIHREKAEHFSKYIEKNNNLRLVGILEMYDDENIARLVTQNLLDKHPDLQGIYIATSTAREICYEVVTRGLSGQVKIIATDVFDEMKTFMQEGVVQATLYQNTFLQGVLSVNILYEYLSENKVPKHIYKIRPEIILKSNYINKVIDQNQIDIWSSAIHFID